MKKHISYYSLLGRTALLSLLSFSYSHAISTHALISYSAAAALKLEKNMTDFFDYTNKTSWLQFIEKIKNDTDQLIHKVGEVTRAPGDALLTDTMEFADYILKNINAFIYILEKHHGKNNKNAFIDDVYNLDFVRVLEVCKVKLTAMKAKAVDQNNDQAVETIQKLIDAIESKKKVWISKLSDPVKKLSLLKGLTERINIK
jgi:hypothetical protein